MYGNLFLGQINEKACGRQNQQLIDQQMIHEEQALLIKFFQSSFPFRKVRFKLEILVNQLIERLVWLELLFLLLEFLEQLQLVLVFQFFGQVLQLVWQQLQLEQK